MASRPAAPAAEIRQAPHGARQGPAPWLVWLSRRRIDIATIVVVGLVPFCHPTRRSIATFLPLVVAGLALRTWGRGVFEPQRELAWTGPYAFIRHPLYAGSFLIGLGVAAMTREPLVFLGFVGAFLLMYVLRIRREEMGLRRRHGDEHARYVAGVGAVVPRAFAAGSEPVAGPATSFAWHRVFRHREWWTWIGALAILLVFWARAGGFGSALANLGATGWGTNREPAPAAARPSVPGLAMETARVASLRDAVRGFGTVTTAGELPGLRAARTQLVEAESRQRLAAAQLERLQDLAPAGIAPRKELEAARAEAATADALAEHAREVLAAFGKELPETPLEPDETWVIAQVMQSDLARVDAGAQGRFLADANRGAALVARVDARPLYVDGATGMAPVRLRVHDPGRVLLPGMSGAVSIEVGPSRSMVVVPAVAVVQDGAQPVVFVEVQGEYLLRPVVLGVARDDLVEVRSGVEAGARVVTRGAASLLSAARLRADQSGE